MKNSYTQTLITILSLSASVICAPAFGGVQNEQKWYQVELILFANNKPEEAITESWPVAPGTSSVENKGLNPLVCDYLARFPDIYRTLHDNHPKTDLAKYRSFEPWLFDSRKDYLTKARRKSILKHFEAENHDLHAVYFPNVSYDLLFGAGALEHCEEQRQLPELLEKPQLDFLERWVKKWRRSKTTRAFLIPAKRLARSIRRYLFGSK